MIKILYIGFGYVARFLNKELAQDIVSKAVISRSRVNLEGSSWESINNITQTYSDISHILISIPPHDVEKKFFDRIKEIISNQNKIQWIGYLSSTSVYGDHQGKWVDESSSLKTKTRTGVARVESEAMWKSLHKKVNIFRLSAIYGPGRSVFDRIESNNFVNHLKPNHFFSRAHIDDIVGVLKSSMANNDSGTIYNIADDEPAEQFRVNNYACQLMKLSTSMLASDKNEKLSEKMLEFYAENKKVSNKKMKDVLSYNLKYTTYREGLNKIWKERDR